MGSWKSACRHSISIEKYSNKNISPPSTSSPRNSPSTPSPGNTSQTLKRSHSCCLYCIWSAQIIHGCPPPPFKLLWGAATHPLITEPPWFPLKVKSSTFSEFSHLCISNKDGCPISSVFLAFVHFCHIVVHNLPRELVGYQIAWSSDMRKVVKCPWTKIRESQMYTHMMAKNTRFTRMLYLYVASKDIFIPIKALILM